MPAERLPPAQPIYVLRGHIAQVHALHFTQGNSRLLTGDADGWVVSWSLAYKRPVAVWKAHGNAVLGIAGWGGERIITHGRDHKLIVWELNVSDEASLDKTLPVDHTGQELPKAEVLHTLDVNALNFCAFAWCWDVVKGSSEQLILKGSTPEPILIAVPNALDSEAIDIFQLPSEKRLTTVPSTKNTKTGMAMALSIHAEADHLQVVAGYESGHTMVFAQARSGNSWQTIYSAQPHSQPVLSLAVTPTREHYLTSSADSIIAKHPLPLLDATPDLDTRPLKLVNTKHSGQQGLRIRSDGKIFVTAGWDGRVRVYSAKTMKELAVLKWHREGCYCTAFATIDHQPINEAAPTSANPPESDTSSADVVQDANAIGEQPPPTTDLILRSASTTTITASTATISRQRALKAQTTHWLAAGSKDGKISLWDIY